MTTSVSPHAVLAASKESGPLHATLFGMTPLESFRMAKIIIHGGWLALELSEYGTKALSYLGHFRLHDRVCYYVNHCEERSDDSASLLSGYFLPEFEIQPKKLRLEKGLFNQVAFCDQHGSTDERVLSYDFLTPLERNTVKDYMGVLFRAMSAEVREVDHRLKNFFSMIDGDAENFRLLCLSQLEKEKIDVDAMKSCILEYVAKIRAEELPEILMSLLQESELEAMRKRLTAQLSDCQGRIANISRLKALITV